jgi:hypothetical protein
MAERFHLNVASVQFSAPILGDLAVVVHSLLKGGCPFAKLGDFALVAEAMEPGLLLLQKNVT